MKICGERAKFMFKNKTKFSDMLKNEGTPKLNITLYAVLALAFPTMIEQIMVTFVQYVDTAMVGNLGPNATAAIGVSTSTIWLLNGLLNAGAVGFSVQVAQHIGANDIEKAKSVIRQSVSFVILFGGFIALLGFTLSFFLPTLLGAQEDVRAQATQYLAVMALAMPFNFCILMLSAIIRCSGDTKTPMFLNLLINAINVSCNFLFIYETNTYNILGIDITIWGAGLGVMGAALGSAVSLFVVSMLYLYLIFFKYKKLKINIREDFKFKSDCIKIMLRLGIPVALERSMMSVAQITMTFLITSMGTVAIAANHLAVTAEAICYLPAFGVATAGTALVGQSMGANRKDIALRCGRVVYAIGVIVMTLGGIFIFTFAEPLITFFSDDAQVIEIGAQMLRIVAFAQPCFGLAISMTGSFRGAGDTKVPFIIALCTMWGVRIVASFALAPFFGLAGIWVAMTIEIIVRGLLYLFRFEQKKWMNIKLIKEEPTKEG